MPSSSNSGFSLDHCFNALHEAQLTPLMGRVVRVVGLLIESLGPHARVGEVCEVIGAPGDRAAVGRGRRISGRQTAVGAARRHGRHPARRPPRRARAVRVGAGRRRTARPRGRCVRAADRRHAVRCGRPAQAPLYRGPVNPLARQPISVPLGTGVRAIDALLTCGRGQRVGLFGGSGVGKSTLLGMMARGTAADVVVLALVGERGREVRGVSRQRHRPRRSRAVGRRRVDLRQPAARAHARRLRGDDDRRAFPRSGAERAADDGLGHALRDGAARGRPGGRRAADREGLSAVGVRAAADAARTRRQRRHAAASRRSTRCSSRATITTNRLPTRSAPFSTATSCCRAISPARNHYPAIDVLQSVSRTIGDVTDARAPRAGRRRCANGSRRFATAKIWSASAPTRGREPAPRRRTRPS